jgi:hypothetical protein
MTSLWDAPPTWRERWLCARLLVPSLIAAMLLAALGGWFWIASCTAAFAGSWFGIDAATRERRRTS